MAEHILIVDDEEGIRLALRGILEDEGYVVSECSGGQDALDFLEKTSPDLIFLDVWMADMDGMEVLEKIQHISMQLPVIVISGHGNIEIAVQALRLGAHDFVEKPLSLEKVLVSTKHALEMKELRQENSLLKRSIFSIRDDDMIAKSPVMQQFLRDLYKVAPTNAWVLVTGENGTGKELAAKTIHRHSQQKAGPFVAVNCAAIPEELIESELFGHEKGAFTGAETARVGKFELAHDGTLFLDEIGDMSLKTQAKILRILQEQCFERVGGTKTINVQVRVIAATNKDLEKAIEKGEFRQDLYYRLRVFPLYVPPLRDRKEDLPYLLQDIAKHVERKYGIKVPTFTPSAMRVFEAWRWPGNVREFVHLVERLTVLYDGQNVDFHLLPREMTSDMEEPFENSCVTKGQGDLDTVIGQILDLDYKNAKHAFEKYYLGVKLQKFDGNISLLAKNVGLERSNVYRKLRTK